MNTLRPHQMVAAKFLAERPAALEADKMRVGKTGAAIGACDLIDAKNVLWLTRGAARVEHVHAWLRFQRRPRPIHLLENGKDRASDGVTICSYDLASGALRDPLTRQYDAIVLDESHRLKTRSTRRTKAIYGEKCETGGLAACAPVVWCLSGTPAPNNPSELWPMLHRLMPSTIPGKTGKPMRYWNFVDRYCRTEQDYLGHVKITGGRNQAELKAAMAPFVIRRSLEDVMADAPRLEIDTLPLAGALRLPAGAGVDIERVNAALAADGVAGLAKLGTAATTLRRLTGLAKCDAMAAWVEERLEDNTDKIVLMAYHTEVVEALQMALRNFNPVALYGGSNAVERREAVPKFREDPTCRVFIGNIETAGEAINLSVADEIVMVESSWVPGANEQALARVLDITKTRHCFARFAMLPGSYDEKVAEAWAAKARTIGELFA